MFLLNESAGLTSPVSVYLANIKVMEWTLLAGRVSIAAVCTTVNWILFVFSFNMVQRLTYRRRLSYNTASNKTRL